MPIVISNISFRLLRALLWAALFMMPVSSLAQTDRQVVFRFLDMPPSARMAALGGNHTGLMDAGAGSFFVNPAYLQPGISGQYSASFLNYLTDARYGFASGAYTIKGVGTLGIGVRYVGYGEMDALDANGNVTGSARAGDLAFTAALGTKLSDRLSAGVAAELMHSRLHTFSSAAISASGGLYYKHSEQRFSAGISFRHLGDQITYFNSTREELPFDISAGISKKPEYFPFRLSLTLRQLNRWGLRAHGETDPPALLEDLARHAIFGGEANLGEFVTFRLGYNHFANQQIRSDDTFNLAGASIGLGIAVKGIQFDISRSSFNDIGGLTQISLRSSF